MFVLMLLLMDGEEHQNRQRQIYNKNKLLRNRKEASEQDEEIAKSMPRYFPCVSCTWKGIRCNRLAFITFHTMQVYPVSHCNTTTTAQGRRIPNNSRIIHKNSTEHDSTKNTNSNSNQPLFISIPVGFLP